ncbi:hypothetical protein VL10_23985 [Leclercia adecarboxylata]|nr:hypothetical protein VL10_23985 [Leclercia adecarboxylata]KMN66741.1 hypothetical protein VK95_04425 [Leclercia sp. LK8]
MKNQRKQSGFTILETIVVLMMMVAAISVGSVWMKRSADNELNQSAAANLQTLAQAVKTYAMDNYATLKGDAIPTEITINELTDKHYLSSGFPVLNSYGQEYRIVLQPDTNGSEGLLVLITTENGALISINNMKKIAAIAGSDVGYSLTADAITGNQQGWSLTVHGIVPGHLASASYISGKDITSAESFLRREKFDGHPEWNQMNTDLTITKNNNVLVEGNDENATLSGKQLVFNDLNGEWSTTLSGTGLVVAKGENKMTATDSEISLTEGKNKTTIDSKTLSTDTVDADNVFAHEEIGSNNFYTQSSRISDPQVLSMDGMKAEIKPEYVKIPYLHTNLGVHDGEDESAQLATKLIGCDGTLESQGRLMMLGNSSTGSKLVLICAENRFKVLMRLK